MAAPPVAIDGRMLPHEWIRCPDGVCLKVDAFDHHANDLFPGPTDAAWDLAGAIAEFALGSDAANRLVTRYAAEAGDTAIVRRLPAYQLAYLAFRVGYAAMAAESLAGTPDGAAFSALVTRYRGQLQEVIDRHAPSAP
jgi:hypothetical protein